MKKEMSKTKRGKGEEKYDALIKEVKPKKRRGKKRIFLYLAIIGFSFYAVITIINQNVEIAQKRSELQDLQQQINVVEIQTQYLENVQNYSDEELEEYIKKVAKEDLGYVGSGERIFINVAGD